MIVQKGGKGKVKRSGRVKTGICVEKVRGKTRINTKVLGCKVVGVRLSYYPPLKNT